MSVRRLAAPRIPAWLEAELPFERYSVDVLGRRMHVMEAGDPKGRPVLLLHGNPTWGFLWRKVAAALAGERLRLVMPDLIGLGLSEKPKNPGFHTLVNHARHVGALVDALDLEGVVLVVQDWGGPIGLKAFSNPQRRSRLAGLVVLNTAVGPPHPGFRATWFHRFSQMPVVSDAVFRLGGFPQSILFTAQGDKASLLGLPWLAYVWPLADPRRNVAPLALARMVPDSLDHTSVPALADCARLVGSFRGPSAIVWGRRDPILGRLLKRVRAMLPRATVTETSAGHFLQEEVPEEIAAAIRSVARKLGGKPRSRKTGGRRPPRRPARAAAVRKGGRTSRSPSRRSR